MICLGTRPVPTSSNDVRRDYLTTEAAAFLGLGLAERGESIENRLSAGNLGYRGVGSQLRVPFRSGDRGRLRLAWPVLLRVAGSLAGLRVSWYMLALSFGRGFTAAWTSRGTACCLRFHPLEERGNQGGSGLKAGGSCLGRRLGWVPRDVIVMDRSLRGFHPFSTPLSSVMVVYIAAAESRVRGALWSPDLLSGRANTGPYRSRDGPFI